MTLRIRLVLIFTLASALVFVMGAILVVTQYNYAISQVDQRLASYEKQASKVVKYVDAGGVLPTGDSEPETSGTQSPKAKTQGKELDSGPAVVDMSKVPLVPDVFIGYLVPEADLKIYAFQTNVGDTPLLRDIPVVSGTQAAFVTADSATSVGSPGTMRVALIPQGKSILVLAVSLSPEIDASTQLATNSLISWAAISIALFVAYLWVSRLGLTPIRRVTQVARLINSGDKSQRVPDFPAKTEAQELGEAVNDLLDENQRAEENLRQFVSDAAHELRTPLTAIAGYSTLFKRGQIRDKSAVEDAMYRINEESMRMTRLVNDLLQLSILDQAQSLAKEDLDIVPLIDAVLGDMRVIDSERTYMRSGSETAIAPLDKDLVAQLLVILLTNAHDHSPARSNILVNVDTSHGVKFAVTSSGAGIPEDQQERVFERFARVDQSRQRVAGRGAGLGLAIARAIVERLGGTIGISSVPSERDSENTFLNTVWCRFPLAD